MNKDLYHYTSYPNRLPPSESYLSGTAYKMRNVATFVIIEM